MLDVAIDSAKKAGDILSHYFEMTALEREVKDDKSFVTKADTECEALIVAAVKEAFPDHGILGEEGTDHNPNAEYQWIIDPLDGTNNFVNGIPLFATSIGILHQGEPIVGVIYNPVSHSLFYAEKGKGMFYNEKPTVVSDQSADMGMVGFGPGKEGKKRLDIAYASVTPYFKSKRYLGATALELAYLARGGTEGFICLGLKKWDYAAGSLLVQEAKGTITDFDGNPWKMEQNYFIASNGVCHDELLKAVATFK